MILATGSNRPEVDILGTARIQHLRAIPQKRMKIINLGQSIAILANLGVIAGIVFLGYELRQNTRAVASAASQGVQDSLIAFNAIALDETLSAISFRAGSDQSELSELEAHRFGLLRYIALQVYQNVYFQVQDGAYDAERAEGWWKLMRSNLEIPAISDHWESSKYSLSTEFQEFVETYVMSLEPADGINATAAFRIDQEQ